MISPSLTSEQIADLRQVQLGREPAARENRNADRGRKSPDAAFAVKEVAEIRSHVAGLAGQADGREKGGPGRADIGVGRLERMFRRLDVRTLQEHGGGQVGGQLQGQVMILEPLAACGIGHSVDRKSVV